MGKKNENLVSLELIQRAKSGVDKLTRPYKTTDKTTALDPTKQPTKDPTTDKTSDLDPTKQPTQPSQPTLQPTLHPTIKDSSDPIWRLTDRQSIVLGYFIRQKNRIVRRRYLMEESNLKENTVKTIIKAISKFQFISNVERQKNQGAKYTLNNQLCDYFITHRWPEIIKQYGNPPKFIKQPTLNPTQQPTLHTTNKTTDLKPDSIYIEEEDLLLENFFIKYPILKSIGFNKTTIGEIVRSWKEKKLKLDELPESFQRAEYAVINNSFDMDKPLAYLKSSLIRGELDPPPGYKSPAELQADRIRTEQKRIAEKKHEAFDLWCDNLSHKQKDEYLKGVPKLKQRIRLREIFDQEER